MTATQIRVLLPRWGIVGAKAFRVELDLGVAGGGDADRVVEVGLGGFGFAFYFPDAGVGEVVGLTGEGRDEPFEAQDKGGAEPLDAVVGLGGKVSIVEGDDVGALVAAVAE